MAAPGIDDSDALLLAALVALEDADASSCRTVGALPRHSWAAAVLVEQLLETLEPIERVRLDTFTDPQRGVVARRVTSALERLACASYLLPVGVGEHAAWRIAPAHRASARQAGLRLGDKAAVRDAAHRTLAIVDAWSKAFRAGAPTRSEIVALLPMGHEREVMAQAARDRAAAYASRRLGEEPFSLRQHLVLLGFTALSLLVGYSGAMLTRTASPAAAMAPILDDIASLMMLTGFIFSAAGLTAWCSRVFVAQRTRDRRLAIASHREKLAEHVSQRSGRTQGLPARRVTDASRRL